MIIFSHVAQLEHEAAHQPRHGGDQVRHGQAQDQAGELPVTEPDGSHDHILFTKHEEFLEQLVDSSPGSPEEDDGCGAEVGDEGEPQQGGQGQHVLCLRLPHLGHLDIFNVRKIFFMNEI